MEKNLTPEKAALRKNELLQSFSRMVEYAAVNRIPIILISGDLFDTRRISAKAKNTVLDIISQYSEILFFYLKGNHDEEGFYEGKEIPKNLYLFSEKWKTYRLTEDIALTGIELTKDNHVSASVSLVLDQGRKNIVMMHGMLADSKDRLNKDSIGRRELMGKGIDYLALGHIHSHQEGKLDERGFYAYPGCLEARGFDEAGEHGFMVVNIGDEVSTEFVPFAARDLHEICIDITGLTSTFRILQKVREEIERLQIPEKDMIHVILMGETDVDTEKDPAMIETSLSSFFAVRVTDRSVLTVDVSAYLKDQSLKGEFVRTVMRNADLSEEEKVHIIRIGIKALQGETEEDMV